MLVAKSSNKGTIIFIGTITLVIIIVVIIANLVMFFSNKGLYKVYTPPPTPDNSISPNGNISDPNYSSTNTTFNKAISTATQSNLNAYKGLNPSTSSNEFGFHQTS